MKKVCRKCGKQDKNLYGVVIAPKLNADLCNECINKWFDIRDKIVADAFYEYLPAVNKRK